MYVIASRDFKYGGKQIKQGEIFQLRGLRNDGLMLKHKTVTAAEDVEDRDQLKIKPRCGECGRYFSSVVYREQCGRSHELSPAALMEQRKDRAARRMPA